MIAGTKLCLTTFRVKLKIDNVGDNLIKKLDISLLGIIREEIKEGREGVIDSNGIIKENKLQKIKKTLYNRN